MKKTFAIFCAVILMPGLNAQAWVGGPFSYNNALPTGDDGIYEAVATMTNGTGIYRWAVRNQSARTPTTTGGGGGGGVTTPVDSNVNFGGLLGASSSNVWYYRGVTYYGPAFGMVNSTMGIVSVVGNASTDGLLGAGGSTINNVFLAGPTPSATTSNVGYANSSFMAKISSKAPVKRFSGSGVVSFNGLPDSYTETTVFNDITIPSGTVVTQTTGSSGGESSDFQQKGASRKFKVMGSQVSTVVIP